MLIKQASTTIDQIYQEQLHIALGEQRSQQGNLTMPIFLEKLHQGMEQDDRERYWQLIQGEVEQLNDFNCLFLIIFIFILKVFE